MTTLTTACPVDLWTAYVQLRRTVAPDERTADNPPVGTPSHERDGVSYVVSSMPRTDWSLRASEPVTAPEWEADLEETQEAQADLEAAQQAQAALVVWRADDGGEPPLAQPDKITVIVGMPGIDALTAMGLGPIEVDDI